MLRPLRALLAITLAVPGCTRSTPPAPAQAVPAPPAPAAARQAPWPAGPLRAPGLTISFGLRLVRGQKHAAAAALVRRLAPRHLPGVALFDLESATPPPPPALGLVEAPAEAVARETLRYFGRGLDEATQARLGKPTAMTALVLFTDGERAGAGLRGLTALVAEAARSLGAVVDDPEARLYHSAAEFGEVVARGGFEGDLPVVSRHVVIHSYETDGGTVRSVTVGMAKLGLPDVVVNGHRQHGGDGVQALITVAAQTMAERGRTETAGRLELDLRALRSRTTREAQLASLKKGATARTVLSIAEGEREEGDAENRLVELTFEGKPGSAVERQEAVVDEVFGAEDSPVRVEHDDAVRAESDRARGRLLALKPAWLKGHALGERLMVKAPFRTASGGNEYMWIEVTAWRGTRIGGLLANDPFEVPGLRAGASVEVEEASVFDYLHYLPDGREEGNTTARLLQAR